MPTVVTALDFRSTGWRYRQVPSGNEIPPFYDRYFDDSGWSVGQAGFGTTTGTCSWNNTNAVKTPWELNTDILIRNWVHIPRDAQEVRVQGSVDNDARVYMNGQLVQTAQGGNCAADTINVVVPESQLKLDCSNLLAVHAHDFGVASYVDVRVTYVKPDPA